MQTSKMKKGFFNLISGLFSQVLTICLGIMIPRLVLVNLGSEANGLLNSVNQILVYAGLLEAGVGLATTQALYGPLAKNEKDKINGIMSATNLFYKKTGTIYLILILFISIIYPFIISSTLSKKVIFLVIVLSGLPNAINFYFQGKYKILLNSDGKSYIVTNVTLIIYVFTSICKILLLIYGFDVVSLQLMYLIFNIIQMVIYRTYIKKSYKWLNVNSTPNYKSIDQRHYVLFHQISGLIFSNTDVICLSIFCGLKIVSVYSMYVLLFGMIGTAIQTINSSIMFILGQTFNSNFEKFIPMHDAFEVYNMSLTFSLFCIANIFILPFLRLYTFGVSDINYIDPILPYLFITTYLLENGRTSSMKVINYAGHFEQTKYHAFIEMVTNVFFSVLLVNIFGIYGVILGTIAALLFRSNAMILYASKKILNRSPWITYRRWFLNVLIFISMTILLKNINFHTDTYFNIVFSATIALIITVPIFIFVASIFERNTFYFVFLKLKFLILSRFRKE